MIRVILSIVLYCISINAHARDAEEDYVSSTRTVEDDNYKYQNLDKIDIRNFSIPKCEPANLELSTCTPGICVLSSKVGQVYMKIKGFDSQSRCEYIERTQDVDGMDCVFDEKNLKEVEALFHKRLAKATANDVILSGTEISKLESIYTKNCKFIKNFALSNVINLDGIAQTIDPEFTIDKNDQLAQALNIDPAVLDIVNNSAAAYVATIDSYKSIMFTKTEIDLIMLVLETLSSRDAIANNASKLFSGVGIGNFYLSSILYYHPTKWVVWMNNMKFTPTDENKLLKILEVKADKVKFKWTISNIDRISPSWQSKLMNLGDAGLKFASRTQDIYVVVNGEDADIFFGLKANQTFNVADMSIVEGKT